MVESQPNEQFAAAMARREIRLAREQAYRAFDISISALQHGTPQAEAFLSWVDHQNAAAAYAAILAEHEKESRFGLLFNRARRKEIAEARANVDSARETVDATGASYRDPDQQNAYFGQIQKLDLLFFPLQSAVTAEVKHDLPENASLKPDQTTAVVLDKIVQGLEQRRTAFLKQDQVSSGG
jgi:hypothetical protein